MSQSPPSSGRFGHPALDKIIKDFQKQGAQAEETAQQSALPVHPALAPLNVLAHMLGPSADVQPAQTYDDMLYEAQTRQRGEWMTRQNVTGLADRGSFRTPTQRAAMSPKLPLR